LFIGSTDQKSPFWPAGPTKQDFSPALGSTDRKSSFRYVEPAKEDSMAEFKLSLTENRLFLYVKPTKEDLLAEFKLSLTKNCLSGTFCQQKKTQCPISNSTANLQSIHQKKGKFCFHKSPFSTWFEFVQTGTSLCIPLTWIKLILSLLLCASALAPVGQSLRLVVHEPVQVVIDSLNLLDTC
jgi:hypothetical protein